MLIVHSHWPKRDRRHDGHHFMVDIELLLLFCGFQRMDKIVDPHAEETRQTGMNKARFVIRCCSMRVQFYKPIYLTNTIMKEYWPSFYACFTVSLPHKLKWLLSKLKTETKVIYT